MVTGPHAIACLLAEKQRLLERLEPGLRARVLAALGALILLGFLVVVLAWLGARVTRRYMRRGQRPGTSRSGAHEDDWFAKPLSPPRADEFE